MHILIVTPARKGSRTGNRITAERWARLLRTLGHRVDLAESFEGQPCDVLVALHARKSARSVSRFRRERPDAALIVVLTGTDLYRDFPRSVTARRSIELADRLIVLQKSAIDELPLAARVKARVIVQSAVPPRRPSKPLKDVCEVCVLGHLRAVKDPFRAALAAKRLPDRSRIRVTHVGTALTSAMKRRARAEMSRNPRYRWLGEISHAQALRVLARSQVLVNSSTMEGGANAICEALACGVPVLSSRISGSIGLLGEDYPGYFDVGDTAELAELLSRFEADAGFRALLQAYVRRLRPLVSPERERDAWKQLLSKLNGSRNRAQVQFRNA